MTEGSYIDEEIKDVNPAVVYVVLAEEGEYSSREVWVAGVYETEDLAQKAILDRQRVRLAWEVWDHVHQGVYRRVADVFWREQGQFSWHSPEHFKAYLNVELSKNPLPPEPEHEEGEGFFYRSVPIGRWLGPPSDDETHDDG